MKINNGVIYLEDSVGFRPNHYDVGYTDESGNRVVIPMKLLVRLYEGTKYHHEKIGINWEEFCNKLFENSY